MDCSCSREAVALYGRTCTLRTLSESSCQTLGSDDIKGHCLWSTEEMIVLFRDQLQNLFGSLLVTAESIGLK